jgi:hypothetical protein
LLQTGFIRGSRAASCTGLIRSTPSKDFSFFALTETGSSLPVSDRNSPSTPKTSVVIGTKGRSSTEAASIRTAVMTAGSATAAGWARLGPRSQDHRFFGDQIVKLERLAGSQLRQRGGDVVDEGRPGEQFGARLQRHAARVSP